MEKSRAERRDEESDCMFCNTQAHINMHTCRYTVCAHMWREGAVSPSAHAQGNMENYRERTLVASISSLVSEKCELKARRMKGDKLFSTTVNGKKLRAV